MKIYNTLTGTKEIFKPIRDNEIKMYVCGPTVYNFMHVGNARPLCVFDSLRRYFKYIGYNVIFVQNFTDIDDKIINKANEEKKTCEEVANEYIGEYYIDADGLNVLRADYMPKATENMSSMQKIIKKLCDDNLAYEKNGNVYFRTNKFKNYGKLSKMSLEDLQLGARIQTNEEKESELDFVLWKAAKIGEPCWNSPWGNGRPGWHIECSAMINNILGETIDIHCGGHDLIFPHHENEIAQSESYTKKSLANYWMHNGYINIDNNKMSKSLGNFFTIREIANVYGYIPIRFTMLQSHYKTPMNYSEDIMKQNLSALQRLYNCQINMQEAYRISKCQNKDEVNTGVLKIYKENFLAELADDFNTANAIGVLFNFVKYINSIIFENKDIGRNYLDYAIKIFNDFIYILGLKFGQFGLEDTLKVELKELIIEREEARNKKNFDRADEIRDKLKSMGFILEDTNDGVKLKKNIGGLNFEM